MKLFVLRDVYRLRLAGKNLQHYQVWKPLSGYRRRSTGFKAGKNLKPYQGLKPIWITKVARCRYSRKKPKTLSGIETFYFVHTLWIVKPEKT